MQSRGQRTRKPVEHFGAFTAPEEEDVDDTEGYEDENVNPTASKKAPARAKKVTEKQPKVAKTGNNNKVGNDLYDTVIKQLDIQGYMQGLLHRWNQGEEDPVNQNLAKRDMVNFIFRAAGSLEDMYTEDDDVSDLLVDDLNAKGHLLLNDKRNGVTDFQYPLSLSKPKTKQFRTLYCQVWEYLVQEGDNEVLFGEQKAAVEIISDVLTTLSSHNCRAVRHTAILGGMRLMCSLLRKANESKTELVRQEQILAADTRTLTQLEKNAEESSTGTRHKERLDPKVRDAALATAREKVVAMQTTIDLSQMAIANCTDAAQALFQGIFVHQFRDISEDIRVDILYTLETLLCKYSDLYLQNNQLKYAGWLLNDKSAIVRERSLQVLISLYTLSPNYINNIRDFMNRFRERIIDMTNDVVTSVAVQAIRLLDAAMDAGHIPVEDTVLIEDCILSKDLSVRQEIGSLLTKHLPAFADEDENLTTDEGMFDNTDDMNDNTTTTGKKSTTKNSTAGKTAAAKAAAIDAANNRRMRTQLDTLVQLSLRLAPIETAQGTESSTDAQSPIYTAQDVMEYITSTFWNEPRARVLYSWDAYRSYLLGKGGSSWDDTATTTLSSNGKGSNVLAHDAMPDHHARMALSLLMSACLRATGTSVLDGDETAVPVIENSSVSKTGGSVPGGSSPDSTVPSRRNGSSTVTMSDDKAAVTSCWSLMSSKIAVFLPDLFGKYGNDPELVCILSTIAQVLLLDTFSMQRNQKMFTQLLYQLGRVYELHSSPLALSSIAAALRYFSFGEEAQDNACSRESVTSIQKLLMKLTSNAHRLAKAIVDDNGSVRGSKKGKKKTKISNDDDMEYDEEDLLNDVSGRPLLLTVVLRRLRILITTSSGILHHTSKSGSTAELSSTTSNFILALTALLRQRRTLQTLFDSVGSSNVRESKNESTLEALCPVLVRETMELFVGITMANAERAILAAKKLSGASPDVQRQEVNDLAVSTCEFRDFTLQQALYLLRLRHPSVVEDTETVVNGEEGATISVLQSSYSLGNDISTPEKAYILRCRYSGFTSYTTIGTFYSESSLEKTILQSMIMRPTDEDTTILNIFVNYSMSLSSRDLAMLGFTVMGVFSRNDEEPMAEQEEELEMNEEDTNTSTALEGNDELRYLDSMQMTQAKQEARMGLLASRDETTRRVKTLYLLQPLVKLSLASRSSEKIGNTIVRRILKNDAETGEVGSDIVHYHVDIVKIHDIDSLLNMQLRSIIDGTSGIERLRKRFATTVEESNEQESLGGDESGELAAAVLQQQSKLENTIVHIIQLVKQYAKNIGPVRTVGSSSKQANIRNPLLRFLLRGILKIVGSVTDRPTAPAFLSFYLSVLPTESLRLLRERINTMMESDKDVALTDENRTIFEAALDFYRSTIKIGAPVNETVTQFQHISMVQIRTWLPFAFFYDALDGQVDQALLTKRVPLVLNASLHISSGASNDTASSSSSARAHTNHGQVTSNRKRSSLSREQVQDDDEEKDTMNENNDEDNEEQEEEDDDDDENYGTRGRRRPAPSRRSTGTVASTTTVSKTRRPSGTTAPRAGSASKQSPENLKALNEGKSVLRDVLLSQSSQQSSVGGRFASSFEDD